MCYFVSCAPGKGTGDTPASFCTHSQQYLHGGFSPAFSHHKAGPTTQTRIRQDCPGLRGCGESTLSPFPSRGMMSDTHSKLQIPRWLLKIGQVASVLRLHPYACVWSPLQWALSFSLPGAVSDGPCIAHTVSTSCSTRSSPNRICLLLEQSPTRTPSCSPHSLPLP